MKKFLYRLVMFAAIVLVVQYGLYKGIKYVLDKKSNFRISRYFRSPKHKYFVIGDSRGANSIDEKYATDSLKIDIINLSFNGMPYNNALDLLNQVNRDNTHATIFLEISCLAENGFDGSYSYYASNSDIFKRRYANTVYGWPTMLRLNNEFFLRNIYYLRKSDNDWINTGTISPTLVDFVNSGRDGNYEMFPYVKQFHSRLAQLQQVCSAHGNKLVFFLAPYYPKFLLKVIDYYPVVKYMYSNKDKYNFIDLNTVKLSTNMFADRVHTNVNGAVILTRKLLRGK